METIRELVRTCPYDLDTLAALMGCSVKQIRRYLAGTQTPRPAVRFALEVLHGRVPWPGWEGFRVQGGLILPPGGAGISPYEVAALPWIKQRLALLERQQDAPAQYLLDF